MAEDLPDIDSEQDRLKGRPSRARYDKVHLALERKWRRRELKTERMMREVTDALWNAFAESPYSWCGFFLLTPDGMSLLLGPHRDHPVRSPLPLQGICGRVASGGRPLVVPDVPALGEDAGTGAAGAASAIALPVFDAAGKLWAVFEVDSAAPKAFDEMDQRWLERILKHFQDVKPTPEAGR